MSKKFGIQGELFKDYMDKLDTLGGGEAMKKGVDEALKASKAFITPKISQAVQPNSLPVKGRYSQGGTAGSINQDMTVNWEAMTGDIKIGFDFKKSGAKSIFLMYGTPRMKPATGLKNAVYGSSTQKQVAKIQEEALNKVIKELMEG